MELEQRFSTDEACCEYLAKLRWPLGFVCPRCQAAEAWRMARGLWLCRQCRHQTSVKAGTVFQDSRLSLMAWFRAMWHVTSQKNGASALGLKRVMGWGSYETAWTCLHKLRRAMVRPGRDRLAGVVEVDETYIGGERPGKRGRGAAGKSLVVIAAQADGEKKIGRIRLLRVSSAAEAQLTPAVVGMVQPGSIVRTDDWNGYQGLPAAGYEREILRPTLELGGEPLTPVSSGGQLAQALVAGNTSGSGAPQTTGLLSGRIHLSVQSPELAISRQVVLSAGSASCSSRAKSLRPHRPTASCWGRLSDGDTPINVYP